MNSNLVLGVLTGQRPGVGFILKWVMGLGSGLRVWTGLGCLFDQVLFWVCLVCMKCNHKDQLCNKPKFKGCLCNYPKVSP